MVVSKKEKKALTGLGGLYWISRMTSGRDGKATESLRAGMEVDVHKASPRCNK